MNTTSGRVCKHIGCNTDISKKHNRAKYCDECAHTRKLAQVRECRAKKRELDKMAKKDYRNTMKPQKRDPNSHAAKLLKEIGKPESYIEKCF